MAWGLSHSLVRMPNFSNLGLVVMVLSMEPGGEDDAAFFEKESGEDVFSSSACAAGYHAGATELADPDYIPVCQVVG